MKPPRMAVALLRRVLPDGVHGESILRDLREEYLGRVGAHGAGPTVRDDLWYWREALLLAANYVWARLRHGPPTPAAGRPLHQTRSLPLVDRLAQDLSYALRRLRRSPGFTAVALVTIALGIGANVAIFSVVDAVLLRPLPYDQPEELVAVWESNASRDSRTNVANPGNFHAWRESSGSFEDMAAITMAQPAVMTAPGEPVEISARYMSGNYLPLLGLEPALGRYPDVVPEQEGEPQVVLSHRFWARHFGGDPAAVGRTVTLNGLTGVIVGVLPREYLVFGENVDLLAAIPIRGDQTNTGRYLNVVGRLADGVELEVARAEMGTIAAGLSEAYPDFNGGWSVNLVPLRDEVVGDVRTGLLVLLAAVGLLLLIACANVANLLLARATERSREMAIRSSLGAGRGRLAGQLMVESVVVAGLGALLGTGLAWWGTRTLASAVPDAFALPRVEAAGLNGTVVAFAVAVTAATALFFGVIPAVHAARTRPGETLQAEARGPSMGSSRVRSGLVVGEVALSLVLLAAAALLARSFESLTRVDPGLDPEGVVAARVALQGPEYQGTEPDVRFFTALMEKLRDAPGVEAVGGITFLPFTGLASATRYDAADQPAARAEDMPGAEVRNVTGEYFRATGMRLLEGRFVRESDRADSRKVVVVSRALAESHWPGESALGRRILLEWGPVHDLEVVGVVDDVLHHGLDAEPEATLFLPYAQQPYFPFMQVVVRSTLPPAEVGRMIQEAVRGLDPAVPVSEVRALDDVVAASVARPRVTAFLMGVFAVLAAVLAAVGLYGVLAYTVSRRVREIGVRIALGAEPRRVLRLVVREGMALVVLGVGIGLAGSLLLGRFLESLLFGVEASDPLALIGAAALLLAVGTVACAVPAWRATGVDPAEALRAE